MNLLWNMINDELLRQAIMEEIARLHHEILQNPDETQQPREALVRAYQRLTDEQKMAFILAGGAPSLFSSQQCFKADSDTETGQLPILCSER